MDCSALEVDAVKFAKSAVVHDQKGKYNEAIFFYKVSYMLFQFNASQVGQQAGGEVSWGSVMRYELVKYTA